MFSFPWILVTGLIQELWGWLEPYVDDEEEFTPSPSEGSMTIGSYVRKIIRYK